MKILRTRADLAKTILDMSYQELSALGLTLCDMSKEGEWKLDDPLHWSEMIATWAESHMELLREEQEEAAER